MVNCHVNRWDNFGKRFVLSVGMAQYMLYRTAVYDHLSLSLIVVQGDSSLVWYG